MKMSGVNRPAARRTRGWLAAAAACVAIRGDARAADEDPKPYTTWRQYGGSADSMQYSALSQINRANVKNLERAWFNPVSGDASRLPFNPLVVDA